MSDYEIEEKQLSLPILLSLLVNMPPFSPLPLSHEVELHHGRKKAEIPLHFHSKGAQNGAFQSSADLGARVRGGVLIVQRLHREHCQYHSMKGKIILK